MNGEIGQSASIFSTLVAVTHLYENLRLQGPLGCRLFSCTQAAMSVHQTYQPTPRQIAEEIAKNPCTSCGVLAAQSTSIMIDAYEYVLAEFKTSPTCDIIEFLILYYLNEQRFPSFAELIGMLTNETEIAYEPDAYCEAKRVYIPTSHLDRLGVCKNDTRPDLNCSICLGTIPIGSDMYKLPCGDCFHATECLGEDQSILTWLRTSKRCPNCNQEVKL